MERQLSYFTFITVFLISCGASYPPDNYGPRNYPPSYQTYDRRLIDSYKNIGTTHAYEDYQTLYKPRQGYNGGYDGSPSYGKSTGYGKSDYDKSSYGKSSLYGGSTRYGGSPSYEESAYGVSNAYGGSTKYDKPRSYDESPLYGKRVGFQNYGKSGGYGSGPVFGGYQTRNTYVTPHSVHKAPSYQLKAPTAHVTTYSTRQEYGKPQSYSTKQQYGKPQSYSTKQQYGKPQIQPYKPDAYDPCHSLPEGDYSLQGEFRDLFPGVDAQCNFIKCANYKAYINPCSMGTKNSDTGGPDHKYGYCASLDYNHYCGHYPSSPEELHEYK